MVYYDDARVEFTATPRLHTYPSPPDPRVKRKTGFLMPKSRLQRACRFRRTMPYYWDLAPNKDVTITPITTPGRA